MKKVLAVLVLSLFLAGLSISIGAETKTTQLTVQATVVGAVTVTVQTLDFGNLAQSENTDSEGTITVNATNGINYKITLDAGNNLSGSIRKLKNSASANFISYWLYRDEARTQEWGDSGYGNTYPTGTPTDQQTGNGTDQQFKTYGRAEGCGVNPAGSYQDFVVVTVHY